MIFTIEQLRLAIAHCEALQRDWETKAANEPVGYIRAEYQEKADECDRLAGIARCELAGLRDTKIGGTIERNT